MYHIKDRFKEVCEVKKIRQVDLIKAGGNSRPTVSAAFTGRQKPNLELIQTLINLVPELNARWLFTGKGPMLIKRHEKISPQIIRSSTPNNNEDVKKIRQTFNGLLDELMELRQENRILKENINFKE